VLLRLRLDAREMIACASGQRWLTAWCWRKRLQWMSRSPGEREMWYAKRTSDRFIPAVFHRR